MLGQNPRSGGNKDLISDAEQSRKSEGINTNEQFQITVCLDLVGQSVGALSNGCISQRQSAHKYREHNRLRVNRAPEHLGEKFRPNHFVDEGRSPRAEEENQKNVVSS